MARNLLAAVAALLLCAPSASATIVVQRDLGESTDEIWAYDDSGGNGRLLIPDMFEDGQSNMFEPSTTATGADVVFTGRTPRYDGYSGYPPLGACGRFCYGVYVLSGGAIRRISPPAADCPGFPCVIFEGSAELAPGGSVVFDRYTKLWHQCGNDWCATADGQEVLAKRPFGGGAEDATVIATPEECGNVESPAPHPATTGLVAFVGCYGSLEGDYKNVYYVSTVDAEGEVTHLYYDDFPISDPSWSADGSLIVDAEGGAHPGVWITTADGLQSQHVLAIGEDEYVRSPRFAGSKVVFVYKKDVYSIDPQLCGDPCSIAQATKLTTTGDVASVAHTTASPQAWVEPGSGDAGGGTGGCTTNCGVQPPPPPPPPPGPTPGPVVRPAPLDAGFALSGRRTLRGLLAGRLAFRLSCDCAVTATLRLGRTVVAKGSGTPAVKLKPTKAGKRKLRRLRRAKLKLVVRAGDRSFSRTLTLKR